MASAGAVPEQTSFLPDERVRCPRCRGLGRTGVLRSQCLLCAGRGLVSTADGAEYCRDLWVPCTECDGTGETRKVKCKVCEGCGGITAETAAGLRDLDDEFQAVGRFLRYLAIAGFAVVGGIVWILMRFQMTVLWCVLGTLLALVAALLVFGTKCVACQKHIWPWESRVNARYSDCMDSMHEHCCTGGDQ